MIAKLLMIKKQKTIEIINYLQKKYFLMEICDEKIRLK